MVVGRKSRPSTRGNSLNVSGLFEFVQFYFLTCWSSLLLPVSGSGSFPYKRMKPTKRYISNRCAGPSKVERKGTAPFVRQVLSVGEKTENIPLASHHYRRHHSHVISPAIVWVCTHTSNVPANSNALSHPFRFCLEMFTILLVRCPRFKGIIKGKIRKKSREL